MNPALTSHFPMESLSSGMGRPFDRISFFWLCCFAAAIPFEGMPVVADSPADRFLGLLSVAFLLLRITVNGRGRRLSFPHAAMLTLVAWSVLSVMWSVDPESTMTRSGTYSQMLVLAWLIWELASTETRVLSLLQAYVCGAFAAALYTLENFAVGTTAAKLYAEHGKQVWEEARYSIAGLNENDLGLMLALSIPPAIYLIYRSRRVLVRSFLWLHLSACMTAILLTASRGALLSACVGWLVLPLLFARMPGSQKIMALAAAVAVIAGAITFIPPETWSRILRLGSDLSEGTMTHRTVIWGAGLTVFRDHPFLGVGAGAYAAAVHSLLDLPLIAHNTFLSMMVELGIFGLLLFALLLLALFYCALRMRYAEASLWTVTLLTWCAGVSALAWEYRKPTWVLFSLLTAHAYAKRASLWGGTQAYESRGGGAASWSGNRVRPVMSHPNPSAARPTGLR